jgi:hypothetical protein
VSAREYADFRLRMEVWLESRTNAGIVVRGKDGDLLPINAAGTTTVPGHPVVKLYDSAMLKTLPSGTTHWLKDAESFVPPAARAKTPAGGWLAVELEARGESLTVRLGKEEVTRLTAARSAVTGFTPGLGRTQGRVGFQVITGEVRFRNVTIEELPPKK